MIARVESLIKQLLEEAFGDDHLAGAVWASRHDTFGAIADLTRQIARVAVRTEAVPTVRQVDKLVDRVLTEADRAEHVTRGRDFVRSDLKAKRLLHVVQVPRERLNRLIRPLLILQQQSSAHIFRQPNTFLNLLDPFHEGALELRFAEAIDIQALLSRIDLLMQKSILSVLRNRLTKLDIGSCHLLIFFDLVLIIVIFFLVPCIFLIPTLFHIIKVLIGCAICFDHN